MELKENFSHRKNKWFTLLFLLGVLFGCIYLIISFSLSWVEENLAPSCVNTPFIECLMGHLYSGWNQPFRLIEYTRGVSDNLKVIEEIIIGLINGLWLSIISLQLIPIFKILDKNKALSLFENKKLYLTILLPIIGYLVITLNFLIILGIIYFPLIILFGLMSIPKFFLVPIIYLKGCIIGSDCVSNLRHFIPFPLVILSTLITSILIVKMIRKPLYKVFILLFLLTLISYAGIIGFWAFSSFS